MSSKISVNLPADLPEDWKLDDIVSPNGFEGGLTERHGYNYLMKQVNNTQKVVTQLVETPVEQTPKNLLHNWDFLNPVVSAFAFTIPRDGPGVSVYNDPYLQELAGTETEGSVVAISSVVGKHVPTGYFVRLSDCIPGGHVSTNAYETEMTNRCIGAWELYSNMYEYNNGEVGGAAFVECLEEGLRVTLGPQANFRQKPFCHCDTVHIPSGTTLTVSCNVVTPAPSTVIRLEVYEKVSGNIIDKFDPLSWVTLINSGINKVSFTTNTPITSDLCIVIRNASTTNTAKKSVTISNMKLEIGDTSTLTADDSCVKWEEELYCSLMSTDGRSYKGAAPLRTGNYLVDVVATTT